MEFKYPTLFVILFIISLCVSVYYLLWRKKKSRLYFMSSLSFLNKVKKSALSAENPLFQKASLVLYSILLLILIITAARPQLVTEKNDDKFGLDIIVAVDASGSMYAGGFDNSKNRIAAMQKIMDSFIAQLKNDRVGLIAFSSNFFTLCPLTHDYEIFKYYVDFMDSDESKWYMQGGTTAVGDAIIYATDKFQQKVDRTKIIILLTDGASNRGIHPVDAAKYAQKNKVKVYTLLIVGNDIVDPRATQAYQQVADLTDGFLYEVKDTQQLQEVFEKIQSEEKKKIAVSSPKLYFDNPIPFILFSGILLVGYLTVQVLQRKKN